jgi:3-oxoacyl-[acyl-carrier-protein] synthase II
MKEQVVVTGMGLLTALGDLSDTWQKLCAGKIGIVDLFDTNNTRFMNLKDYKTRLAGAICNFNPSKYISTKQQQKLDRGHQLAIVAALQALEHAGLTKNNIDSRRVGIYIGSSVAGTYAGHQYQHCKLNNKKIHRNHLLNFPLYTCLTSLAKATGFSGMMNLVSTACTASTIAIATALQAIRLNQADIILAGGVDPLTEFSFAGFNIMNNVSLQPCAPFSLPMGLTLGEGAGMMILENRKHAEARGAKIYGEIADYSMSADAWHSTSADPSGQNQRDLILNLLARSETVRSEVHYFNAHGTGTPTNDAVESKGIHLVFNEYTKTLPVSSSKGAIGHTLAAAGAIEAIITLLAVHNDVLPPTANFTSVRDKCDLNHIKNQGQKSSIQAAITQNFAFGGNNAALLIRKLKNTIPTKKQSLERVVITGMGILSPIGNDVDNFVSGLQQFKSGISIATFNHSLLKASVGILRDFDPHQFTRSDLRRFDKFTIFTVCGTETALKNANYKITKDNTQRTAIICGSSLGALQTSYFFNEPIARSEISRCNPTLFTNTILNSASSAASIQLRLKGPNIAINIGQASGLRALALAYDAIKLGDVTAVIAGGVDELEQCAYEGYHDARQIAPLKGSFDISCPFDKRRNGMLLGEGAVFFILESLSSAVNRGAKIYAEVLGHHCSSVTNLHGKNFNLNIADCMHTALNQSGLRPHEINYIGAGALSRKREDYYEAKAIKQVFKDPMPPVCAFSSVVGVSAATSLMSLASAVLSRNHVFMPYQLNYEAVDEHCDLNIATPGKNKAPIRFGIINSLSLGGLCTSLVFKNYSDINIRMEEK